MFERLSPEQHDTLPEIPEPAENPSFVGHEDIVRQVVSTYRAGKLHHALLLGGPQGIGKATFAFHLARHLLQFSDPADAPGELMPADPQSSLARQLAIGAHPAVLYLTRPRGPKDGTFKSEITVGEIRRVNRLLAMTSHDRGNRVVIVDPVDDLNRNAANALLKNLEEPPSSTFFLLIAHSPGRILKTILSRCLSVRFNPLDSDTLLGVLDALPLEIPGDNQTRTALAEHARGSVRNAVLLTQFGGFEISQAADEVLDSKAFNPRKAHEVASAIGGRDQKIQFDIFNRHLLDRLATTARQHADAGNASGADRFSALWQETSQNIAETEIYNLDRKQHVVSLLHRLNRAMQTG